MAKEQMHKKSKRREKVNQIDHIPNFSRRHRSHLVPKRRTDFSLFSSSSNAPLPQDLLLESPSSKETLSGVTIASLDETKDTRRDILDLPLVQCIKSQDKRQGLFTNYVEVPVIEVDSVNQNARFEPRSDRNVDKPGTDTVRTSESTPDKSQITKSSNVCITPGSIVWAKTARQLWWPAEILGERSTLVDSTIQGINGHVLVQYYGNHGSALVDPARDISQFEDCFEERRSNPLEEFQDALKQALHHKEHRSSCKQLFDSPAATDCSNQEDKSPDKWNSSSSSRAESENLGRGRSKRKRKPKVHFDEMAFPLKSARKVRRFRIMRFLGLAAPIGSPFLITPHTYTGLDGTPGLYFWGDIFVLVIAEKSQGFEFLSPSTASPVTKAAVDILWK